MFLANYSDGLTDLDLHDDDRQFRRSDKVASFLAVPPSQSFHLVDLDADGRGRVASARSASPTCSSTPASSSSGRRSSTTSSPARSWSSQPFARLIEERQLHGYRYDRFWCMDTFKEQQQLTDLYNSGRAPWEVWKRRPVGGRSSRDAARWRRAARRRAATRCCASARTATTSRSGAAARSCGCCASCPIERVTWVVLSGDAGPRPRRPGAARARVLGRHAGRAGRAGRRSATASSPTPRRRSRSSSRSSKREVDPDLVLTHYRDDRHQDHRLVSELTYNTFRDHLVLEYEIMKIDGDLGQPERLRPARRGARSTARSGCWRLLRHRSGTSAGSTRTPSAALMRLRGIEAGAPSGYAEAFYGRKLVL